MVLRQRIYVAVPVAQVWIILRDPSRMSLWSIHCVHSQAQETAMRVGLRFQATMRLGGGPAHQADCEVMACEPERLLILRMSGQDLPRAGAYVEETFLLQPVRGGTKIVQKVDLSHSAMPWFLQALMKIMALVGRRRRKSSLDCLKELAEGSS